MTRRFRLRPLHRQRQGRHQTVKVLNQAELIELLGCDAEALPERLDTLGWRYHRDGSGLIWATAQDE